MTKTILLLHIAGAVLSAGTILISLWSIYQKADNILQRLAVLLATLLGFELITGSILAILNPSGISLLGFCRNIGLYTLTILLTEAVLYYHMPNRRMFPKVTLAASSGAGLLSTAYTLTKIL
jgi:hypothetical protein